MKPPAIDCINLRGSCPEVLKPGLFEGQDYVLIPEKTGQFLISKYKATSNTFIRKVINVGSKENKLLQIELYPIELYFYICTKDKPTVGSNDTPKLMLVSKKYEVSTFIAAQKQGKMTMQVRFWLKCPDISTAAKAGSLGGRLMVSDVTDRDGPWLYMRYIHGAKFGDLLVDEHLRLEAIVELYEPAIVSVRNDYLPRASLLNAWKKDINVGDVIDFEDGLKWHEAIVTKVSEEGNLSVHLIGWGAGLDKTINKVDIIARVEPLHTKTEDWRENLGTTADDSVPVVVDINVEEPGFVAHWLTGTVEEVDLPNLRAKVKVNQTEWDTYQFNKIS